MSDDQNQLYKFVPEAINDCEPSQRTKIFSEIMGRLIFWSDKNKESEKKIQRLEQALESIAAHSPSERDREIAKKALGRGDGR